MDNPCFFINCETGFNIDKREAWKYIPQKSQDQTFSGDKKRERICRSDFR